MGKISKATASKSYNQKTLAKMKARDAAKNSLSSTAPKASSSGGSSSSQAQQLATIKATLEKMSADLAAGKVTGLTPSPTKVSSPTTTTPTVTPAKTSTYQGPSIVDYLNSTGQASDFNTRAKLAANAGITGYTGTADQNTALLNKLRINTSGSIPSTAVTNPTSTSEVMDYRQQLENIKGTALKIQDELKLLQEASQTDLTVNDTGEVTNYDRFLSQYNTQGFEKTPAQLEQERLLNESATATEDFYKNRDKNIDKAYDEYGVTTKQKALSNIQKEMAEREVRLRESIKALETAPEYRGVSREFAVDQREAIKSEGAFDLANLAIVESAYRGDLETSRSLAQDLIDNQFNTFEGKLAGYKARLAALMPQLNADEKRQALQLEQAFNAQERALAEKKADTELRYEYMTLAAQAGAPESVYKAILKATSADEAFMLAAPYMQKKTTGTTGGGGGVGVPVGGISEVVPGLSSYNIPLANLNFNSAKMADIKDAVNQQFAPMFSSRIISELTEKQLRDFLIKYDAQMRSQGQNIPPEIFYQFYLEEFLNKNSATGGSDSIENPFD